jgi:propionate--CoA ligase
MGEKRNRRKFTTEQKVGILRRHLVDKVPVSDLCRFSSFEAGCSGRYAALYRMSVERAEEYWAERAERLLWYRRWDRVLDASRPPFVRYFVGGETNICHNAVDRHALGPLRARAALIWESVEIGSRRTYTYHHLYREVNRVARALRALGVERGHRVLVYMPMVPEAVMVLLACARIGAIHAVVFGGFAAGSLAERIDDARPTVIVTADAGRRAGRVVPLKAIVDEALARTRTAVDRVVVLDRGLAAAARVPGRDEDWGALLAAHEGAYVDPVRLESSEPSYILYTSGTTGRPKGVVRDTGGHMVALNASMAEIYDCHDGDVFWSTSDIGWVVGHSYVVYAPLLAGLTTVVYEGPIHPDASVWWRVVERYGVTTMFSAPTALRVLKKARADAISRCDIRSLRALFLAGEPLDAPTYEWARAALPGVAVYDHYWQTESGWPMLSNMPGIEELPVKPGSPTKPVPGYRLAVVDQRGDPVPRGTKGFLVAAPPLPPGTLLTLWGDDVRFVESYWRQYEGKELYQTGDYAIEDEDGYFWVLGRSDEVINVAGHRLGTREVEEVVAAHAAVAETCAVGVSDEIKGQALVVLAVLRPGAVPTGPDRERVRREIATLVRDRIGAIAVPRAIRFVELLPKTRSGKIMRRVIRAVVEGRELGDLSTIEEGASVDEVREAISTLGSGH